MATGDFQPAASAALVVRDAWLVPLDAAATPPFRGYLLAAEDGRIRELGPGEPPAAALTGRPRVLDARGAVVLPGFVSAHSHLWQSPFRGIASDRHTMDWMQAIHVRIGPHLRPGDMFHFTRHGAADLLRCGVTTAYNHTHDLGSGADEQWEAAFSGPQRTIYGFSVPMWVDAAARRDGFLRFARQARGRAGDPRLLGLAVNTTGFMSVASMADEVALARRLGLAMQAHFLEDPRFAAAQQGEWADLVEAGRVGPDVLFAHFIHATDGIVADAARLGAGMVWNPLSNGRLGSGLPDIVGYRRAGLRVGMGVDGQASADVADPFQNMRTGLYALRMQHQDATVMTCEEILRLHTFDTAALLGLDDQVGSLAPGRFADLVVVDLAEPDTGPVHDLYPHLVFAASAANIRAVYVGGELVVSRPSPGPARDDAAGDAAEVRERVARLRHALGGTLR